MKTRDLIEALQRCDPDGTVVLLDYDGVPQTVSRTTPFGIGSKQIVLLLLEKQRITADVNDAIEEIRS